MKPHPNCVDEAFLKKNTLLEELPYFPVYDRIICWQIPVLESDRLESGLYLPQETIDKDVAGSPRMLILAAGPLAMDHLRDHGIKVGDTIWATKLAMYRLESVFVSTASGSKRISVTPLTTRDINVCEQTVQRVRSGEIELVYDEEKNMHVYKWADADLPQERKEPPADDQD